MPTKKTDYTNASQQTLMVVVAMMAATPLHIWTVAELEGELAAAGEPRTRDQIFRALENMAGHDWVEQTKNGTRLGPAISLISERIRTTVAATLHHLLGGVK